MPIATGTRMISVARADTFARKRPSLIVKAATMVGKVGELVKVSVTAKKKSFQAKMMARSAAAVNPGAAIGTTILTIVWNVVQPSSQAPSNTSFGSSRKYERAIQIIRGRFIAV